MKQMKFAVSGMLILFCLLWAPAIHAEKSDDKRQKTLIIAKVGDNPKKVYPRLKPLAEYLASRLQDQGIERGEVKVAQDNKTMISWLKQGKVDLVTETPFSAVFIQEKSGAVPIARGWRKGVPTYHSIIFVHKESGIESLSDLKGKVIAFEDEGSTSAYFLPVAEMLDKGFDMLLLSSVREKVSAPHVGYVFSGEEINSTTWVHKQLVSAAALSNLDWDSEETVPSAMKEDLKIIYRTSSFPRSVELVCPKRPELFAQRLMEELHLAHTIPEGLEAMKKYKSTSRFEKIDSEMEASLKQARKLLTAVKDTLE